MTLERILTAANSQYPASYHQAAAYLVAHGPWRFRLRGRRQLAAALRDLRRARGHAQARADARHLRTIAGMFPPKHTDPRYRDQDWAQPDPGDE